VALPTAPELAIKRTRSGTERRARTTAVATLRERQDTHILAGLRQCRIRARGDRCHPEGLSSSSVHIQTTEHQLTQDEIVPVVYRQAFHRWQILPVIGICLVIRRFGAAKDTLAWVVMLTLGAAVLLIFFVAVPLTPNRIWNRVKKQFSERWRSQAHDSHDSVMKWPMFSDVNLRNDLYLLTVGKGPGSFMIPRRAFTSEADEEAFYSLAKCSAHPDHQGP
jgi:hypothetical protein